MTDQTKVPEEQVDTNIKLSGKVYDLAQAFPLTLGDWEAFEKIGVMKGGEVNVQTATQSIDMIHHLLSKINGEITRDSVLKIPLTDLPDLAKVIEQMTMQDVNALMDPTQGQS